MQKNRNGGLCLRDGKMFHLNTIYRSEKALQFSVNVILLKLMISTQIVTHNFIANISHAVIPIQYRALDLSTLVFYDTIVTARIIAPPASNFILVFLPLV